MNSNSFVAQINDVSIPAIGGTLVDAQIIVKCTQCGALHRISYDDAMNHTNHEKQVALICSVCETPNILDEPGLIQELHSSTTRFVELD